MIRYADGPRLQGAIRTFGGNPFGVRALAGVLAYGTEQPFTGAWVQGRNRLLVGRTEGALTLYGNPSSAEEAFAFLNVIGGNTLLMPSAFPCALLQSEWQLHRAGVVLRCTGDIVPAKAEIANAETVMEILSACESPWLEIGDRDAMYTDLSHRIRHGCIRTRICRTDGVPVACAITVGETADAALIGGVACLPSFRGHGLAGQVLQALSAALMEEKKQIFVFTGAEMVGFYQRNGFEVSDRWQEWIRKSSGTE